MLTPTNVYVKKSITVHQITKQLTKIIPAAKKQKGTIENHIEIARKIVNTFEEKQNIE